LVIYSTIKVAANGKPRFGNWVLSVLVTQHHVLIIDSLACIFAIKTNDGKLMISSLRQEARDPK
jgi:hypothetical protein|tara:strand:- start:321 stop:512 length:192 start_codon:yes stop_codon:yes gene_type:complete